MTRGGRRKGAGRPKKGDKVFYAHVTPEEYIKLKEYLDKLRKEEEKC